MKKNILFVINKLSCGGAEKSLISLLQTIDYSKYNVDLFLFKHEGVFLNRIPKEVKLIKEPTDYKYFDMSIKKAIIDCLKKGRINLVLSRIFAGYIFKSEPNPAKAEQRAWKHISKSLQNINKHYDTAIGYLEKNPIYFSVDKVKAAKKIGFIHSDYDNLGMDSKIDKKYFDKLDNIITVSQECANVLKKRFSMYTHKINVMYNIVSPNVINQMSFEESNIKYDGIKIVSVGRLSYEKGFDMSIEACKKLVESGYKIKWYLIGDGEDRDKLKNLIKESNLKERILLMGIKENPYPYIREADIYVQPSRFEGKSIAIDEAKILHKPIVVTNFRTAKDQIINGQNGLIVDMNSKSIAEGIKKLIDNNELINKFKDNLSKEKLGTESEIEKLYKLIG
ncbi:glycosyltransferase [Oceanirhabdus sp. W0125-5]|uniref:glycosyltransferase n=1 Tax=Oceanirhabdus sp. W0125-5 TaxID=2999116 RepID=UPI0022F2E279|nr:glycosyltransferase [Oceanirhabdus sp. W0125-5]WBW98957.1 glycosyltransferase [Oceanirhabdus sp. W0125-5]